MSSNNNESSNFTRSVTFIEVLYAFLISYILISAWQHFIETYIYVYLGLNKNSAFHTFIVALTITIIFIALVLLLPSFVSDIIEETTFGFTINGNTTNGQINNNIINEDLEDGDCDVYRDACVKVEPDYILSM